MLPLLCLVCLVVQVSTRCLNPPIKGEKPFPDVLSNLKSSAFYLTAEVNVQNKDKKETAFFEEIVDIILQIGTVNYLQGDFEQVVYYIQQTGEMFEINSTGTGCTTSKLAKDKSIFPNPNLKQWYHIGDKNVFLGPFSVIQNALKTKTFYSGPSEQIRGIPTECWTNCFEKLLFTYCFSDSSLPSPYGFTMATIPLRVTVTDLDQPDYKLTYEYFNFNPTVKADYVEFPRELGCKRLKEDDDSDEIPSFGTSDLRLHAEIVFDDLEDQFPNYITNIELVYKYQMRIAAFSFTEWKTEGKESKQETPEKTIFNLNTGSSYTINKMTGECNFGKKEFSPRLLMPDKSHLAFDNPELLVEGVGFYKADTINDDRGFQTMVYEKQTQDFFMGSDYRYPKASITRYYLEDDTYSIREPTTKNIPSKVVLKLKSPDGIDRRIITINIFTFTKKVNDLQIFDIDDCFTDEEEYSWIQFRFNMPPDQREEIIRRSVLVPETLKGLLYSNSEVTPLRLSKFLVDYDCNGMTVSGKLYEHIALHGYTPSYKKLVKIIDGTKTAWKKICAFLCDWNKDCSGFSECSDTCILTEQKPVETEDNSECITYIKDNKRSPNATELVKSFEQILIGPTAQLLVLPPRPDTRMKLIELSALSIETSQNYDTGRRIPNIFTLAHDISYEVDVEVNYQEAELMETIYFEEKYDIIQQEGKIVQRKEGNVTTYFYFQGTNEVFTITSDDSCSVDFLNDSRPFAMDFLQNWGTFDTDNTILGPSSVLRNAFLKDRVQNLLFVSSGDRDIRGISNMYWMHCPTERENTTVKYYFSRIGNKNPFGNSNGMDPLRVRTYGMDAGSEDLPFINQTYEFFSFKPFIDPESIAVPYGLGCQRLASEDDLLTLPPFPKDSDYILGGEVVFDRNADVKSPKLFSYFQVIYDHVTDTLATKYSNWKESREDGEVENTTPYKLIRLRSGVTYFVDLDLDNCTVMNKELISRNLEMPDGTDLNIIDLVLNTSGFIYLDRYRERDLPVLGFERVVEKYKMAPATFDKAIITRFTLDDDVYFIRQERFAENAPVRVTAKLFNKGTLNRTISLNIFTFKTMVSNKYKLFNIDECYLGGRDSTWFQVMYPVDDSDVLKRAMQNVQRIKDQFIDYIISHSQTSPHRFADILVETDDASIFVLTKLLERPDPLVDFKKREKKRLVLVNQEFPLLTAQECAVQCLESNNGCGGFSYCGATCQLANEQESTTVGPALKFDRDCSFYEFTAEIPAPTSRQVLDSVKALVENGEPSIVFPPNKDYSKMAKILPSVFTIGASSRFGNIFRGNSEFLPTQVQTKYKLPYKGNRLLTLPLAQCLTVCSQDTSCTSVSVCIAGTEKCIVSTLDPFNIPDDAMTNASSCAILGKSYVGRFSKYPGVSHVREPEKFIAVESLEECAKKCFTESSMKCLSFDLCDGGSTCYLHSQHGLDISSNSSKGLVEKSCAHYSKRYMFDFKLSSREQQSASGGEVKLYDASLEQCARACADGQKGIYCMSFDFCAQSGNVEGTCLLSSEGSGSKLITKPICNHFLRIKDLNVSSTRPYSYSLAGGLAFLFILIGVVLGAAALYGYGYFKANRQM